MKVNALLFQHIGRYQLQMCEALVCLYIKRHCLSMCIKFIYAFHHSTGPIAFTTFANGSLQIHQSEWPNENGNGIRKTVFHKSNLWVYQHYITFH